MKTESIVTVEKKLIKSERSIEYCHPFYCCVCSKRLGFLNKVDERDKKFKCFTCYSKTGEQRESYNVEEEIRRLDKEWEKINKQVDITETKAYKKVLEHRKTCPNWKHGFCMDCFGGGLTTFTRSLEKER